MPNASLLRCFQIRLFDSPQASDHLIFGCFGCSIGIHTITNEAKKWRDRRNHRFCAIRKQLKLKVQNST